MDIKKKDKIMVEEKKNESVNSQHWFTILTYIGIPIIGFIYLIVLSRSNEQPIKQEFAKAYIKFKLVHLATVLIILTIIIYLAIPYFDKLLAYMELL